MASAIIPGQTTWSMTRSEKGHRVYKVRYRVRCAATDGPAVALNTVGLPRPGDRWNVDGDLDLWAYCLWTATVNPVIENEPNKQFEIEFTFTTEPPDNKTCKDNQVTDPLLEPMKVSGSFNRVTEEATHDRFGKLITNSAHQSLKGPKTEFDRSRAVVKVEQNVAQLGLTTFVPMIDTVNDRPLWGMSRRCVKLGHVSWERRYQGACQVYYTRTLEFDLRADGFDRDLIDEGTMVLNGHWGDPALGDPSNNWVLDEVDGQVSTTAPNPDPANPGHFITMRDREGNPRSTVLDGFGSPIRTPETGVTDWKPPTATGNAGNGSLIAWTSTGNITADDVAGALFQGTTPVVVNASQSLYGKAFDFSDVADGATIARVDLLVRRVASAGANCRDTEVQFFTTTGDLGQSLARTADEDVWAEDGGGGAADRETAYYTWDSSTGLDPSVVTGATVKGAGFGVRIGAELAGTKEASLYYLALRVVYKTETKPGKVRVEKYDESNFLLLGIPTTL